MSRRQRRRSTRGARSISLRRLRSGSIATAAAGIGVFIAAPAIAQQLPASAFQTYNPANAASIAPGPFSLFTVPVDSLLPTQINEGFTEVDSKTTGFDLLTPSQLQSNLLGDIE